MTFGHPRPSALRGVFKLYKLVLRDRNERMSNPVHVSELDENIPAIELFDHRSHLPHIHPLFRKCSQGGHYSKDLHRLTQKWSTS